MTSSRFTATHKAAIVLVALAWFAPSSLALAAPPIRLPQARINHIDLSEFPQIRVFATILDRGGRPVQVKAIKSLKVSDGKLRSRKPYIEFGMGQPLDDRKDGKMLPADKAGVINSSVVVVAGYQHESLRRGSLGRRLKEAVGELFKGFAKTDRVNVIWYGDRLYTFVAMKGRRGELSDIEESRKRCRDARIKALSGAAITGSGAEEPPPPGTDLCGLSNENKTIGQLLSDKAFFGYFPRLFNLGLPFYSDKRYCKPPRESLNKYGQITPKNARIKYEERETMRQKGEPLDFETSAVDEALQTILREARAGENKSIILISDGVDGYFKDLDQCRDKPPARCRNKTNRKKRERCVRDFLNKRLIAQQSAFRSRAVHWVGAARAAGIRIFSVGLATLGKPYELERLRLLAERTGGTYRKADSEGQLGAKLAAVRDEVLGQLVIDFTHQEPDEVEEVVNLKLEVRLDETMVRGRTQLKSKGFRVDMPKDRSFIQSTRESIDESLSGVQEALGYQNYVIVGIALLVIGGLLLLIITLVVMSKMFRWFFGLFSRDDDE